LLHHFQENVTAKGKLFEIKPAVQLHIIALSENFSLCFPEERCGVLKKIIWIKHPFAFENF
jgi:hypothetical protein